MSVASWDQNESMSQDGKNAGVPAHKLKEGREMTPGLSSIAVTGAREKTGFGGTSGMEACLEWA